MKAPRTDKKKGGQFFFFVFVWLLGYKLQLENHWFGEEVAEEPVPHVVSPKPQKEKEKRKPLKMWDPGQNLRIAAMWHLSLVKI